MAYLASNYTNNAKAPQQKYTCAPGSALGPYEDVPPQTTWARPSYCGQCVSYVKQVCPSLPDTGSWKQGEPVKDNSKIIAGTVIATFNAQKHYEGHAAIYVSQSSAGILVYDQYVFGRSPKPVSSRTIRWDGHGVANQGTRFYVVE